MNKFLTFFASTLLLILGVACSDDDTPTIRFEVGAEEVFLGAESGAEAQFEVVSNHPWQLQTAGEGYEAQPNAGGAGTTIVKVKALRGNQTEDAVKLGDVWLTCSDAQKTVSVAIYQRSKLADRTILLYMPGRDLISFYEQNIEGAEKAISEGKLPNGNRLLLCYQPDSHSKATFLELTYNSKTKLAERKHLKSYEEFDTSDAKKVAQMLEDVANFAPAKEYGLIIGSHGRGWIPKEVQLRSRLTSPYAELFSLEKEGRKTRSFGDGAKHSLDIVELREIIENMSYPIEFLMFDACFMSGIETLYDLRGKTKYIVASPCEIMAAGFPYDRLVEPFFSKKPIKELLEDVCWQYWNFYQNDWEQAPGNEQSGCIALADMKHIEKLAQVMRKINGKTPKEFDINKLQVYEGLSEHLFYDLGHWVELSCTDDALKAEFNEVLDEFLPRKARLHTPQFYSDGNHDMTDIVYYSGISFSEPSKKTQTENRKTAWYKATH